MTKPICIVGAGGFGREILQLVKVLGLTPEAFIDDFVVVPVLDGIPVHKFDYLNPSKHSVVVAIGDPHLRELLVNKLPTGIDTPTLVHPTAIIGSNKIGKGSVICAYSVLTTGVEFGDFVQININCTIGHDTKTGKFFTVAPGSSISGGTKTGDYVRFGPNTSTVEKIYLTDDVFIGAGAVVTKNLLQSGVYMGIPAQWKRSLK